MIPDRHESSVKTGLDWLASNNTLHSELLPIAVGPDSAVPRAFRVFLPSLSCQTVLCVWQV